MSRPALLIVDDKHNMVRLMAKVMRQDAELHTAHSGAQAVQVLSTTPIDAVLCDLKMPDMDGMEVLKACAALRPQAQFILMTAYATVDTAIEALKLGAFDYLTKPFDPETGRAVVLRALQRAGAARAEGAGAPEVLPGVIARSPVMRSLAELVRRIADSDATALLIGETGTGKERVARAIHELSPRANARYVALNCAAVPAELLESELFGHSRGAFTGAIAERKGLFEEAEGGSLLLDEIGDMQTSLQAKLTRALEERAVRRVGEARERPVDVRLIAATHQDLEGLVRAGAFREDLWYRLNVALITIPPLRDRRGDVELLAHHFLQQQAAQRRGQRPTGFSRPALDAMAAYEWPGNVRQLRSAVERACVVSTADQIELADLPRELLRATAPGDDQSLAALSWADALERGRAETGRRYLEAVMRRFDGRVAEAASHAGVERESFYRLLRRHGIDAQSFRPR